MRQSRLHFCYRNYRYCGPGCSGPGIPINPVDRCCLAHDECYARFGRSKHCDYQFQQCLKPYKNPYSTMGREANLFSNLIKLKGAFF